MRRKVMKAYINQSEVILKVREVVMDLFCLINKRAEILYELLDDLINFSVDEVDNHAMDALKASFVLRERSISSFQCAFSEFGLFFDVYDVEEYYERYSAEVPGPSVMMME